MSPKYHQSQELLKCLGSADNGTGSMVVGKGTKPRCTLLLKEAVSLLCPELRNKKVSTEEGGRPPCCPSSRLLQPQSNPELRKGEKV